MYDIMVGMKDMYEKLIPIQYICLIAMCVEGWIVLRKGSSKLHLYFFFSIVVNIVNSAGYLFELNAHSSEGYLTALKLSYLGRVWVAFSLFLFVTELCRIKVPSAVKIILALFHIGTYIAVLTIRKNELFYKEVDFIYVDGYIRMQRSSGIVHIIQSVSIACYIVYTLTVLIITLHRERNKMTRKCLATVIIAMMTEAAFAVVQIFVPTPITYIYDLTMPGFAIGTVIMLVAIFRFDLLATERLAKELMIDRLSEGIIAVDKNEKVQYFNEHAKNLYPELDRYTGDLPASITEAIGNGSTITIKDRIYKPEENDLVHGGKDYGKLYALVDETEHYSYMQILEEQKQLADSANRAKSAFLANMSHDIRTPINAVLGMNEMIQRECGDEHILSYSEKIRSAGNTLLGLVNDILDLSKIEAGKLDIIPVDYDLTSVLNDLVNMLKPRADAKELAFETTIDKDIPKYLHGDEIRLKQIITNILTNAVKYTEKGSVKFSVSYEKTGDDSISLKISVADTGIGIKPEDIPKLFSEFDRIDEERNRAVEGTGLGMAITQRLLSKMDSRLDVKSEYGKGSVFSFAVSQKVVKWEPVGSFDEALRRSLAGRKKYRERFTAPDAEILVVDDTPMNIDVFVSLLKKTLMRIDTASSGDECIALAAKKKYDIIFLDHMMPEKNGIETLGELKAMTGCPNAGTPMICITANAVSGSREKYLNAGFDDCITKPVDPDRLEQIIMEYLPRDKVTVSSAKTAAPVLSGMPKVLVIDDDPVIRETARNILKPYYDVKCCADDTDGTETAVRELPDLILLDINIGDKSGFDVLRRLRDSDATRDIPVMFITGDNSEETEVQGFRSGASDYVRKPFVPEVLLQRSKRVIDLYHYQSGLIREVGIQTERADRLSLEMMIALSKTVDAKDHYTNGHSGRVAEYSAEIARRMGKTPDEQEKIYEMGLMHDIGKIGVSEEIINKTSRLTDEEFAQIKKHTVIGYDILSSITEMPGLASGARSHHERYDGSGYPDGLKGRDIPEAARIICVADCYDAMTSTRTYSKPRAQEAVRAEIERCSGSQFDPDIAAVMIKMIDDDTGYKMNEQGGAKVWKNKDRLWNIPRGPEEDDTRLPEWLYDIAEIDTAKGLLHCGGAETYLGTLTTYAGTAAASAGDIERFLRDGDIKNATVKIHALKSTSRMIGAAELGDLAEELEAAGNAGNTDNLNARTGELLARYKRLGELLSPLTGAGDLPLISDAGLNEAYTLIREFLSVEDYESVIQVIGGLGEYSYPDSERERCEALKKAAAEFDYEAIKNITED